jgi:copper resistance protein B
VYAASLAPFLLTIAPAAAQDHSSHTPTPPVRTAPSQAPISHAGHEVTPSPQPAPTIARGAQANAADLHFDNAAMARARRQLIGENGGMRAHAVIVERMEASFAAENATYAWHAQGWYGGDINRFWWKFEGEGAFENELEDAELQLLYSRAVTPYFDVQAGIRQSYREDEARTDLVLGMQGLAPYWLEVGAAAFVSPEGDVTARAEAEYDLRLTQRLILQPSAEINFSAQDILDLDVGGGFTDAAVGVRLRCEFSRRWATYFGVEWTTALGKTRDIRESRGQDTQPTSAVIGLRALF